MLRPEARIHTESKNKIRQAHKNESTTTLTRKRM